MIYNNFKQKQMGKKIKRGKEVNSSTTELYDKITKLQTQIIDKITIIKKNKPRSNDMCTHLVEKVECPAYNPSVNYYQTFWRTFLLNQIKKDKVETYQKQVNELNENTRWLERKFEKYEKLVSYRKKKDFHSVKDRVYECKIKGCSREYLTLTSLKLHQQLKHPKQTQTVEKIQEDICNFFKSSEKIEIQKQK